MVPLLKHILRRISRLSIFRWSQVFGFNPATLAFSLWGLPAYLRDYIYLRRQSDGNWKIHLSYPCHSDRFASAGCTSGHYFHQDFYVARRIFECKPIKHVDVGSRIDGFVTHVASFRIIELMDVRPLTIPLHNICFKQADFTSVETVPDGYCDSLSCLHALEHFGLGRYGDIVDINGWKKGMACLVTLLQQKGILYLSVPIGKERIDFNAHRVFSITTILNQAFTHGLNLLKFSYVDDEGSFHQGHSLTQKDISDNLGLWYGCGIFEFRKLY